MALWYISYADPRFVGACVVQAENEPAALAEARFQECCPSRYISAMVVPMPGDEQPERQWWNRLLTKDDVKIIAGPEGVKELNL